DEGYAVLEAANGLEGIERLQEAGSPSLVLLDLWMPVMDGWQMLETLRKDPKLNKIPVIVISAAGGTSQPEGAVAFLKKPVRLEQLLTAVQAHSLRPANE